MTTILIADHNPITLEKLEHSLERECYEVIGTQTANQVAVLARDHQPDLVLLDLELPEMNGLFLAHEIRSLPHLTHVPILFLSGQRDHIVRALDAGGDDLIARPFAIQELLARIRALLRRSRRMRSARSLMIDSNQRQVWVDQVNIDLTPTEFDLLAHLCEHENDYLTSEDLLQRVWRYPPGIGDTALVRNHIHNLRHKLEISPNRPQIIVSLHGRGYRINARVRHTTEA